MKIIDFKNSENSLIGKVYELPRNNNGDVIKFDIENFVEIQEDELSRIDKLSYRVFNSDLKWEELSKLNGIQDPFNLDNSFVFIVLSHNYSENIFKKPKDLILTSDKNIIRENSVISQISTIDSGRQERISKILYKFGEIPTELRKPIYLKSDEKNLEVKEGVIVV